MTAKELIEVLQEVPPDTRVFYTWEGQIGDLDDDEIEVCVARDSFRSPAKFNLLDDERVIMLDVG